MTRTLYTLSNGTVVKTYAEALASGLPYKVTYETIEEKPNIFIGKVDKRIKI